MSNIQQTLKSVRWAMIGRCYNPNLSCYKYYGGRGITVCDEWRFNKESFFDWAMSHGYDSKLQLDRIDNNKGYYPENCRFVTSKTNMNNTRKNVYLTHEGVTKSVSEWCQEKGGNVVTVMYRRRKFPDTPFDRLFSSVWMPKCVFTFRGETKSKKEWCEQFNILPNTLYFHHKSKNWPYEKALEHLLTKRNA